MAIKPVIMVLYTNDAVEVRYSDQSRLHILPCGTSFTYHTPTDSHPVHGMSTIQQRSCFVTSQFRHQLISALDFRNRFAERPFLCSELLAKEDIVNLYAKIQQIAWPKAASKQHCEVLEDGSVSITSLDEFASVILSPHRKDFTVCYLSLLSQDRQRERMKKRKTTSKNHAEYHSKFAETKGRKTHGSYKHQDGVTNSVKNVPESFGDIQTPARSDQNKHTGNYLREEDLNISPITQASCAGSPSAVSHASGSPVTPADAVKDVGAKFRPFSTPTEELESVDYDRENKHLKLNRDGSFLGEDYNHPKKRSVSANSQLNRLEPAKYYTDDDRTLSGPYDVEHMEQRFMPRDRDSSDGTIKYSGSDYSGSSGTSDPSDSETRCSYCWVTRHISRDECPLMWNHAVKMAEVVANDKMSYLNADDNKEFKSKIGKTPDKLRKIKKDDSAPSQVPIPLPLTCQGQHLHKSHSDRKVFDDGKDPLEDWTSLSQGRLKVILVEGVIYRIVRLQTINIVEIYPGDGSVLFSQGMSAHFFLHIIPGKDKVEERTYSVKSPPQTLCGTHSVKSLLNRAHRLLAHVRQEVNMASLNTGLCCWKHEEVQLAEPLSTVMLEDCNIPGYGKFTAMSNGQIRILFNDRTALDMTCDFSKRLKNCLNHSTIETSVVLSDKKAGICRLLLPNGHYQMVDIEQPGQYKKYIQMAKEWTDWVNSSPAERGTFYKDRIDSNMNTYVDRELQRIKCFNYLVDNTVLNKKSDGVSSTSAFRPYGDTGPVKPGILRNIEQNRTAVDNYNPQSKPTNNGRTVTIYSPPHKNGAVDASHRSASSAETSGHMTNLAPPTSLRLNPIGQSQPMGAAPHRESVYGNSIGQNKPIRNQHLNHNSNHSSLEGFNAVRQALLQTSSVIKDLDAFLDKR